MKRFFSFSRTPILTAAAALVVALAITTPAGAAPIRFDNPAGPGHFEWNSMAGHEFLDIFSDASSQPGIMGAVGTFWRRDPPSGTTVRGAESSSDVQFINLDGGGAGPGRFLVGVSFGETIPTLVGTDGFATSGFVFRTNADAGFPTTNLPEGQQTYLGVQFDLGIGIQYGWIGVTRTGMELDAFAWGYETEPGVPIAAGVPEPGTLSLLAIAGGVLMRRRRRAK